MKRRYFLIFFEIVAKLELPVVRCNDTDTAV